MALRGINLHHCPALVSEIRWFTHDTSHLLVLQVSTCHSHVVLCHVKWLDSAKPAVISRTMNVWLLLRQSPAITPGTDTCASAATAWLLLASQVPLYQGMAV